MIPEISAASMHAILPLLGLLALASVSLMVEVFFKEKGREINGLVCALGCVGLILWVIGALASGMSATFAGALSIDAYSLSCMLIFLSALTLALLMMIVQEEIRCGEVFALTIFSAFGACIMAASLDLFTLFLGLEVMSLSVYALAGAKRTDVLANEASLKYFLLGAFSSAFFLYGIVQILAACGGVSFVTIAAAIAAGKLPWGYLYAGMGLIVVGFGFKVALVPFHQWAPDVYEGSPTAVTAFMTTAVKAGAFAGFMRCFVIAFADVAVSWQGAMGILAVLTMTLGNVVALSQKSLKRTLAYSSIAHAGYILLAVVAASKSMAGGALASALFYLTSYTFMTAGAFAVLLMMDLTTEGDDEQRFAGLGFRRPLVAVALTIFLLSLAGIPPTAGFVAKFYVFSSLYQAGHGALLIAAILNSLVSLYYYLRPMVWMYMQGGTEKQAAAPRTLVNGVIAAVLAICVAATLALGVMPSGISQVTAHAAASLFPATSPGAGLAGR